MDSHYVKMGRVGSQHRNPAKVFRPTPDEYAAAEAVVKAAGFNMNAALRGVLRWLAEEPQRFGQLRKHVQAVDDETVIGRPPGSAGS